VQELIMRRNWKANEKRRRNLAVSKGLPFKPQDFGRYMEGQEARNLDSRKQAQVDDAVDMDLDKDDGDEYAPGDEIGFDKEDAEERAAYGAGSGDSSSSSGDEDEEGEDDGEDIDALAERLGVAEDGLEALHTRYRSLLDGPKKKKDLADLYASALDASSAIHARKGGPTDKNVLALELIFNQLSTAVAAHVAATKPVKTAPPKAPAVPAPAGEAEVSAVAPKSAVPILDLAGGDERIILEGFNAGIAPEVTAELLESLVAVVNAFIGTAHHIPGLETPKASQFLGLMRSKLFRMVDPTVSVKNRINKETVDVWLKVQRGLVGILNKAIAVRAAPAPPAAPSPPASVAVEVEDAGPVEAMEVEEDGDEPEEAGAEEYADAVPVENGADESDPPVEEEEVEEQPEEEEEEEEEEDEGNVPDKEAKGSAEEATKDKAPVHDPKPAAVVQKPQRVDSLDVIETKPTAPATSNGAKPGTDPTFAVLALKLPGRKIFLVGTNEAQLRTDALKRGLPAPPGVTPESFFDSQYLIKRLPMDWKHLLENDLKQRPVATSLLGKEEAQIWKTK